MAIETRKTVDRYIAFKIESEIIDRIAELFARDGLQPSIVFNMSDDTEISTNSFDELKKFPNTKERRIEEVKASSLYSQSPRIELTFRDAEEYGGKVSYTVTGEDRTVLHLTSEIDSIISAARMWWTPIVSRTPYLKGVESGSQGALLILSSVCMLMTMSGSLSDATRASLTTAWQTMAGVFLVWSGINWTARFIFPAASFATGQGVGRFKMRENWRLLVLLATVVGVAGGLITLKLEWLVK
ncbi:hypothetical protein NK718_02325 [Alsobacter sp. SYSU M60028]|uniref:Uncharacterized protein n=1 Tax=Alsobacter ponti TaxID=2962936 RepID=A0ABT1L7A5_9HYPH|nr:hypothetical protein [Alsobacter ponti]MCP8937339.1 hypothetical protein [Alsobacter ponti]